MKNNKGYNEKNKNTKTDEKELSNAIEIIEDKKNKHHDKSNKKIILIYITITVLSLICIATLAIKSGKFNFITNNIEENDEQKVELKYTDSVTVKQEGVYITDVSEIVDEVMPSIVAITSKTIINSGNYGPFNYRNSQYTTEGAGSGVIVAENDNEVFILTNYHVVENTNELSVKFIDEKSYDATIKGVSERKDIAIVSVSKKDIDANTLKSIKIATLGDSSELKVGNGIIAIGNALGYGQSVTTGVVSALNREVTTDEYTQEMIQIDAAINGGNSGGALLNSKGEVVGINTAKYSSNSSNSSASIEGMGFAIPISDVKEIIETLINGKNDTSGLFLGIEGYMTNTNIMANYGLPEGFYITKINSNSNAEKAGLEIGNIITEIDNTKVTSTNDLKKILNKKNPGDKITLKIKYATRNEYKEKEITITLN